MLFGAAVISGGMLLWPLVTRLTSGHVPQVGAFEAVQLINRRDALVLDVRDKAAYAIAHIPNARNIPQTELESRLRELEKYKSRPIVVNCQSGTRSAAVHSLLQKNGFEAFALRGGLDGWVQASMPVEKSAST